MPLYIVNKQAQPDTGDHEVHETSCSHLPLAHNQQHLGYFSNCYDAVREAKKYYQNADGCAHCSSACHTS